MTKLADAVRQRIVEVTEDEYKASVELLRAEELADMFAHVVPEAYILPLDALAGFAAPSQPTWPNVDESIDITA